MTPHNLGLALIALMFAAFMGGLFTVQMYTLLPRRAKKAAAAPRPMVQPLRVVPTNH